jgi:hypothetical protein
MYIVNQNEVGIGNSMTEITEGGSPNAALL